MALIVAGASHRTADLAVRERFAVGPAEWSEVLRTVVERSGAVEGALLSTCNRTEFYLLEGDGPAATAVWSFLGERLGAAAEAYGYVRRDRDAVAHLYRVTAGLDSMILGEAQIQGQVRDAWERSRATTGAVLTRLAQSAGTAAARVRTETAVARGAASVSSAAVQLAKQIFGSLRGRSAMVLGAGETAELALESLSREGVRTTTVANRTSDRATALAARYGARAVLLDQSLGELGDVDILLCSTGAPDVVVHASPLRAALASRRHRPLCVLDIAVPRDVDPAVRALENVYLYDLDDLQAVVAASIEKRQRDLPTAEAVISAETERFWQWLAGLSAVPVLTGVRSAMEQLRERELAEAMRRLGPLSIEQAQVVEQLSRALMNKFLHAPTVRLRAAAANGRGLAVVDAARYLFALDSDSAPAAAAPTDDRDADDHSTSMKSQ